MTNSIYLEKLLDDKNKKLWNSLIETEEIVISVDDYQSYGVYSESNHHTIEVPLNDFKSSSFAHELLHIHLSKCGVNVAGCIEILSSNNPKVRKIFSRDLIDNIGNNLNHMKMVNLFLELGYEIEEFIDDYNINKGKHQQFSQLQNYFCFNHHGRKVYLDKAIDVYIGIYFSAKACPNKSFNYATFYDDLRNIDFELIEILERYISAWDKYDYNNRLESYHLFTANFIKEIELWCDGKEIFSA
ncbi:hypothetical protein ACLI1A_04175 [Flavobacterium sp. RHBU_3]|uniref:hypothetical protein n=1 Tax=Flavobacterium sp. RHBU_3 TaxID=3391184 RepID=UPI0039853B2D